MDTTFQTNDAYHIEILSFFQNKVFNLMYYGCHVEKWTNQSWGLMQIVRKEGNKETRELEADTFKILTQGIVTSNENRREKIKQNLLPNYRKLCDNPPSATKLFGDKLEEDIKKMKESKTKLTPFLQSQNKHFLSKRGEGSWPPYHNKFYPSQNNQTF